MISTFDLQNLDGLLKDFYVAVGIRISIFDDESRLVTEYPKEAPRFCRKVRESEAGRRACETCDMEACLRAKKLRKAHIYTCHAGITEAITPIQIGNGVLGYAILAHMLPKENESEAFERAVALLQTYGATVEKGEDLLGGLSVKSEQEIHSAVRILDAVSSYVSTQNMVRWKSEDLSLKIEKFVKRNLSAPITSEVLCEQFHCSRALLYHISVKAFGMGIMQYVCYCRMENAKRLLKAGKSIKETASECGFAEYNYFCKVFKKYTGKSPAKFIQ